jgi:hypothetical protein
MSPAAKIEGTEEAWETGLLGADEAHVKVAPDQQAEIDAALELHPISIRLQKGLLDNLKALAQLNGIGYQPLVRQILTRFVDSEMKQMLIAKLAADAAEQEAQNGQATKKPSPEKPSGQHDRSQRKAA